MLNEMKENVCYVSQDFVQEVKASGKRSARGSAHTPVLEYVLPNYADIMHGYAKDPCVAGHHGAATGGGGDGSGSSATATTQTAAQKHSENAKAQSIRLTNEHFSVPEALFSPSDYGVCVCVCVC